ncbi:ATP-binding cassette domain-containing protein [Roseomonas sp. CCTCC AB2023176]|uniref:ATP-binding cassette domain-containing protein n=1 Tax=Roseomonas sp. CCTCC AB2023176 TaxID=3342640 RepID=UPI0035D551C6
MSRPAKDTQDGVIALVRAETAAALRLALLVGGTATLATFGTILLKMEVYRLVIPTGSIPTAIGLAAGFAIVAALLVGLDHLRDVALLAAANRLARRLSGPAVLAAAARVGDPAASAGALLADVEEVRRAVSGPLCTAVLDAVLVPAVFVVLWLLHPWFAALAACACALALLASLGAERRARATLADSNASSARTSGLVADAMRCAEAVEAMGMRPALARRWLADLRGGAARMSGAQEVGRRLTASLGALTSLAAGGAMLLGAGLSLRGEDLGIGLMIAMLLTGRVIEPFARFGAASADWGAASAAWARLSATLGRDAPDARTAFPCPEGCLVLERLTYLHPGTPRPLLREVDLAILPGEVVAITGAAGGGKTTLLRLMLGLHRPTAGGAFLDGHATHQWDREDLARHVGYLPQNPDLGEGTIAEVIARLSPGPTSAPSCVPPASAARTG